MLKFLLTFSPLLSWSLEAEYIWMVSIWSFNNTLLKELKYFPLARFKIFSLYESRAERLNFVFVYEKWKY